MVTRRTLVGLCLLAGFAGCTRRPAVPPSPNGIFTVGDTGAAYTLTAVDDRPLPAIAYLGVDVSVRATGGTLRLGSDHTYALAIAYDRHFASGNRDVSFRQTEQGSWAASGDKLTLTPAEGGAHTATIAGARLAFPFTVEDSSPPERATKTYTFTRVP